MKLLVAGLGACGGRIADQFARLGKKAKTERGIDFLVDAFAIDTDAVALDALSAIKPDTDHRIVIGGAKASGGGLGRMNELGAEIAKEEGDRIVSILRRSPLFADTDAFLLAGAGAGGTGSGTIAALARFLKESYPEKPVYGMVVLPFEREELTERRADYNTGTCLKSLYLVADTVLLVDNERYLKKEPAVQTDLDIVNTAVVGNFYNLLCASEERKPRFIGSNMLRTGDMVHTLYGWTTLGCGRAPSRGPVSAGQTRAGMVERSMHAMTEAMNDLSVDCSPADCRRALCLITAPSAMINVQTFKELGDSLRRAAPEAMIRSGDYPRDDRTVEVTIVLSEITSMPRAMEYFDRAVDHVLAQKRRKGIPYSPRTPEEAIAELPLLL
ncbi:MAG: cell division protein FtsZ [Chloroflexota bacterium]